MPRFFVENPSKETIELQGESAKHIVSSLRMEVGDNVTICDGRSNDYLCTIVSACSNKVVLKVDECVNNKNEPNININLYQAMPKGSKFEYIIQKSVELGVTSITPVLTKRCISRPNEKSMQKKIVRYNKIAKQAAKQSGRGIVPVVYPMMSFEEAILNMEKSDINILFYECYGEKLNNIDIDNKNINFMIGSEGGFEIDEVKFAKKEGLVLGSLGNRILRCETAPVCVLSVLMYKTKNL